VVALSFRVLPTRDDRHKRPTDRFSLLECFRCGLPSEGLCLLLASRWVAGCQHAAENRASTVSCFGIRSIPGKPRNTYCPLARILRRLVRGSVTYGTLNESQTPALGVRAVLLPRLITTSSRSGSAARQSEMIMEAAELSVAFLSQNVSSQDHEGQ